MGSITKPRFLCTLLLVLTYKACFSIATDSLMAGQSLSVSQTITSQGSIFELGFFRPGTSSNIYLGIWYKSFADRIIVWVANRDKNVSDPSSSRLELTKEGNLVLLGNSEAPIWSTNLAPRTSNSTESVLFDNGNFVLRDVSNPSNILWQSFDHPTNTWLPGGKLGINKVSGKTKILTSWKNSEDPAPGLFSVGIDPNGSSQYFIQWNRSRTYWSSGLWNGKIFSSVPEMRLNYIFNYSFVSNENETYFTYSVYDSSILSRLVMDSSGQIKQLVFLAGVRNWNLVWSQPRQQCGVYAFCGAFGICNEKTLPFCECLPGFEPFSVNETSLNDWSSGCVRKTPLQCENSTAANGKKDGFIKILEVRLPVNAMAFPAGSSSRCKSACMENCSCTAYAYNSSWCSTWEGNLLNLLNLTNSGSASGDIYVKLSASDLPSLVGKKKQSWVIKAVSISLAFLILVFFSFYLCMRKLKPKGENDSSEDLLLFNFDTSLTAANDESKTSNNLGKGEKNVGLPFFSFASVSAATNNFSTENKLGEGGFGPVYKGKLQKGSEIAVKRLSKRSGQGVQEFRNEIELIAKLQHRNLVRLLGCCIQQDENILIYEYMPNKSLDFFLFDPSKGKMLDWGIRIQIIQGIAQGLLYLHQHSRLRIIHRDLKASNILLDSEMSPKISDFGMARIFKGSQLQGNTNRIVGTYGYMSPEYAMEGIFSIKSDVFSFGVLLLEIVCGKKNTGFYHSESLNLLGYAWDLWIADKGLNLLDPVLDHHSTPSVLLRYINVGFLCVQESPTDRPTMSDVISMLGNDLTPLPIPKRPAFFTGASMLAANSVNSVTISEIGAR